MENSVMERIKGGLIVSCQALKEEPLYSSYIMSRMAYAAMLGGAVGIRANTVVDIEEIKKTVDLPIIGIIKEVYGDCSVFITPTTKEIEALITCGVDIIATDATNRIRPDGRTLDEFFGEIRAKYPDQLFMADCSTYEEGMHAAEIGFDFIGTTLHGYTEYTKGAELPNIDLVGRLAKDCGKPVIAEGGIWLPEQLKAALDSGVWAAVIGGAITRPMEITKRFVAAIQ
ncbi:MAG: N-acetylmannosamine-6-phosphate 2-epimerase [Hungatella hathewayi]|nr:N-acetylmannosamine-6-phosphate 2-epimerase [Hungatella hathewayi]